jgi:hypothetical protein
LIEFADFKNFFFSLEKKNMSEDFEEKLQNEYGYEIWPMSRLLNYIQKHKTFSGAKGILFVFFYLPYCGHCHDAAKKLVKFHEYCKTTLDGDFPVLFRCINAEKEFSDVNKLIEQHTFPRMFFFDEYGQKCQHDTEGEAPFNVENILKTMSRCEVKPKPPQRKIKLNIIDLKEDHYL